MHYQSFVISDKQEWDGYMKRSLTHEIFHTWHYHSLNTEGEALLFVYEEDGFFIALPVIKRKIENSPFFDMTSAYGYCGPISDIGLADLPATAIARFKTSFLSFMEMQNAVCIFTRLHPFLNQQRILQNIGGLQQNGTTLYIDLLQTPEEQRNRYDKRLSRQIRKLREKGYTIKELDTAEGIKSFTAMYWANMKRVNASAHYYFDEQYFSSLLKVDGFENKLLAIYDGDELICGALLLISNDIIRNHLSATSPLYLKESPSKLLTDEISMVGRRLGKKIFHLGGGLGGKEDSLFEFKRYFSNLQVQDQIWCYINDEKAYNGLVLKTGCEIGAEHNYFPLYRKPPNKTQAYVSNIEVPDSASEASYD
ncbi:MAG: GNAT family N-acetyltransferase [Bacteroidota bacterium]|nr:GNAT family N-acetyltransferase [Bacteroidota bacterium]